MKAIMWIISSKYTSIRLRSFSSTSSSVQLNLVKVLVMYAFRHHTFHYIPKNENVISQTVNVMKNINPSCCSDVILEQISSILYNFLSFQRWNQILFRMVNCEKIGALVTALQHQDNVSLDNDFCTSALLCASSMKIVFAKVGRISLKLLA